MAVVQGRQGKKMYKKSLMSVVSRCFAEQAYYFFDVLIAVAVAVAKA